MNKIIIYFLFLLILPQAFSNQYDVWLGWRGFNNGNGVLGDDIIKWSSSKNVNWKTHIPGIGYSSPVINEDYIFLTTAYDDTTLLILDMVIQIFLYCLILFLIILILFFLFQYFINHSELKAKGIVHLELLLLTGLILIFFLFFGENLFNFQRCNIRSWIASGVFFFFCGLLSYFVKNKNFIQNMIAGSIIILASFIFIIFIPNKDHAFRGGFLSQNSVAVYIVFIINLSLGLFFLISRKNKKIIYKKIKLFHIGIVLSILIVLLSLILMFPNSYANYLNSGKYIPTIKFPIIIFLLLMWLILLFLLLGKKINLFVKIFLLIIEALTSLFILFSFGEYIISSSDYLSYHFGKDVVLKPMLGWNFFFIFIFCSFFSLLIFFFFRNNKRKIFNKDISILIICFSLFTGLSYYASNNLVSQQINIVQSLVEIDRSSGKILFSKDVYCSPKEQIHNANSYASPTPVIINNKIIAFFGDRKLVCLDFKGNILWKNDNIRHSIFYGTGISLSAYNDQCILLNESDIAKEIIAIDSQTGLVSWKKNRNVELNTSGNHSTPIIGNINKMEVLIVWSHMKLTGYNPLNGKILWDVEVPDLGGDHIPSLISDSRNLYLSGVREVMAFYLHDLIDGKQQILWRTKVVGPNCSSPVISKGLYFSVSDSGMVSCLNTVDGVLLWREKLKGKFYSSLVAAERNIYISNTSGETFVIKADKKYNLLSKNNIGEKIYASIALLRENIFIRTEQNLFSISNH